MSAMFTEFHDLTLLGFPGWEASKAFKRDANAKGGRALVRAIRLTGCEIEFQIEATDGLGLFNAMAARIESAERIITR